MLSSGCFDFLSRVLGIRYEKRFSLNSLYHKKFFVSNEYLPKYHRHLPKGILPPPREIIMRPPVFCFLCFAKLHNQKTLFICTHIFAIFVPFRLNYRTPLFCYHIIANKPHNKINCRAYYHKYRIHFHITPCSFAFNSAHLSQAILNAFSALAVGSTT